MKITALGVVTCDRTPALRRCLESYAAISRDHDRAPAFIVVDDSRASETQERNRRATAEVTGRFGAPIRYAGGREKRALSARPRLERQRSATRIFLRSTRRCSGARPARVAWL